MFHKILVAIDDSKSSQAIFEQALALANADQSQLMLLHVLAPFDDVYPSDPYVGIPRSAMQMYAKRWQEREQAGIDQLRVLEATAIAAGITTEFTQSVGDPGKLICALAKTWNADLIVIGRRGLSGLSELFMGSVSNYVLHHASCHVLTLQSNALPQTKLEPATTATSSN
ncbi:MAG: universal stress protein [Leptolyngbyaceae cyanobacterium CSU_1_3]|nr:universal stress protein [Leptolyngbyaceae cyanobacterium CSU_1_3]